MGGNALNQPQLRRHLLLAKSHLAKERLITQDLRARCAQASSDVTVRDTTISTLRQDLAQAKELSTVSPARLVALDKECEAQLEELAIQLDIIDKLTQELNDLHIAHASLQEAVHDSEQNASKLRADLAASDDRAEWYKAESKRWEGDAQYWRRVAQAERHAAENLRTGASKTKRDSIELAETQANLKSAWLSLADLEAKLGRAKEKEETMLIELARRGRAISGMKENAAIRKSKWDAMHARAQVAESAGLKQAGTIATLEEELREARVALWNSGVRTRGMESVGDRLGGVSVQERGPAAKVVKQESVSPDLISRLGLLLEDEAIEDAQ